MILIDLMKYKNINEFFFQCHPFNQMSQAGIPRKGDGLISFLDTITLQSQGSELVLESSNQIISKIKKRPTG